MSRPNSTWRRLAVPTIAAFAVLGTLAPQASAATGRRVSITAQQLFGENGTFIASGAGLCPTGSTSEPWGVDIVDRPHLQTFRLDKLFTCDDGSGGWVMTPIR